MSVITSIKDVHVLRLKLGSDLILELTKYLKDNGINFGSVSIIGALENATLGSYSFVEEKYKKFTVDHEIEILQCSGNISILEDNPFAHLHMTVSGEDGKALGGHVFEGCEVKVAECVIFQFDGDPLIRENDPQTGLKLWKANE